MTEGIVSSLQDVLSVAERLGSDPSECPNQVSIADESRMLQQRDEYNMSILTQWMDERQGSISDMQPAEENIPYTIVEVLDTFGRKQYVFSEHPGPEFDNW